MPQEGTDCQPPYTKLLLKLHLTYELDSVLLLKYRRRFPKGCYNNCSIYHLAILMETLFLPLTNSYLPPLSSFGYYDPIRVLQNRPRRSSLEI